MSSTNTATLNEKIVDGYPVTDLTPEQKRKWADTMAMMAWVAPGFRHLFYTMLSAEKNTNSNYTALFTKEVPIAATDGLNLLLNPDTFFNFTMTERVYVVCHEVIHNMYSDVQLLHRSREQGYVLMPNNDRLPFDNMTMQVAFDARINATLDESNLGDRPKLAVHDPAVKADDSFFDIYRRYIKTKKDDPPKGGDGKGDGKGGKGDAKGKGQPFDQLLEPGSATGKTPQQANNAVNPQQWAVETAVAHKLEQMNQGSLPAGMERMFRTLLEPEVYWLDQLEATVKRQSGDGAVKWEEPHPWFGGFDFYTPAETGFGMGWIVLWGDTSGSISDAWIARGLAETAGLWEQMRPSRMTLIWCDAKLYDNSVVEITDADDLRRVKPVGGGGTNYKPVLDWIAANSYGELPELFIGLTDGLVSFPRKEHPFPTVWVTNTDTKFPFGQVIRVKDQHMQ